MTLKAAKTTQKLIADGDTLLVSLIDIDWTGPVQCSGPGCLLQTEKKKKKKRKPVDYFSVKIEKWGEKGVPQFPSNVAVFF